MAVGGTGDPSADAVPARPRLRGGRARIRREHLADHLLRDPPERDRPDRRELRRHRPLRDPDLGSAGLPRRLGSVQLELRDDALLGPEWQRRPAERLVVVRAARRVRGPARDEHGVDQLRARRARQSATADGRQGTSRTAHLAAVGSHPGSPRRASGREMSAGIEPRDAIVPVTVTPPEMTREPVLEIKDLSIAYRTGGADVRAVRGVDLTLHRGEVVGLAGESGCGKSTLAYGSIRLLRPPAVITGGSVTYRGRRAGVESVDVLAADPRELRALRWREIAIVFQSAMNSLNPVLRVRDQLLDALGAHLALTREQRHDRSVELIEMVGIPRARLASYPHELSGGMRQRVMIAMALAAEPEVVIMDEPTTALDVVVQRDILAEIFELKDALGFSVLFITHDLSLLLEIADRVVIMYAGQVVESGTREEIHRRAAHPYTRGLLTSFPRLRGPRVKLSGIPGSPPDLRASLRGCPFVPRCGFATDACKTIEMALTPVELEHLTACPFVNAARVESEPVAAAQQRQAHDGAVVLP